MLIRHRASQGRQCVSCAFPPERELVTNLMELARTVEPISRYLAAVASGRFPHPDGRTDDFTTVAFSPPQAALLAHLSRECATELSIEIGFGLGSSATVILGTRRSLGRPFEHLIFDPYGLGAGCGQVVQSYLEGEFGPLLRRVWERSEVGLGGLLRDRGTGQAGLILVDGGHKFENVIADFALSDLLCAVGGYIVLDDSLFPAIETVVNYVKANRPDYAVAYLPVPNTAVLRKLGPDEREWFAFTPFPVPDRSNWTPAHGV